jgi:hypothetical protein
MFFFSFLYDLCLTPTGKQLTESDDVRGHTLACYGLRQDLTYHLVLKRGADDGSQLYDLPETTYSQSGWDDNVNHYTDSKSSYQYIAPQIYSSTKVCVSLAHSLFFKLSLHLFPPILPSL